MEPPCHVLCCMHERNASLFRNILENHQAPGGQRRNRSQNKTGINHQNRQYPPSWNDHRYKQKLQRHRRTSVMEAAHTMEEHPSWSITTARRSFHHGGTRNHHHGGTPMIWRNKFSMDEELLHIWRKPP